ncbi:MAG: hypothetical protein AAF480_08575 [Actinomycetota bacterium]
MTTNDHQAEAETDPRDDHPFNVSRRKALQAAGLMAGGAAVATVATAAPAGAHEYHTSRRRKKLVVDVACDNRTFNVTLPEARVPTENEIPVADGFPPNGTPFFVEGALFPANTIPTGAENWDLDGNAAAAIGHWFCYGWFVSRADRVDPHVITTQTYLFQRISQEDPFPTRQIQSHGLEGTFGTEVATRSIIGGTGIYRNASGRVLQDTIGTNNTLDDFDFPGANFRFRFGRQ